MANEVGKAHCWNPSGLVVYQSVFKMYVLKQVSWKDEKHFGKRVQGGRETVDRVSGRSL
jgi:hypothetical protein